MKTIQFREAVCEAMTEEMRRDENIFLMGEEVAEYNGAYKASKGMLDEFGPKRVLDTPIAELGFAGISVGAAMNGLRPIVEFMTFNFSMVAIDQIYGDKGEVPEGEYLLPIGVADIKRKGTDVTIVSFGKIIKVAYEAADMLAKEGISCEIIDLRTVRPIDYDTVIESVKKTNRLVCLEEAWPLGSIATEITYKVQSEAFDYLDAPVKRITTTDTPAPYSPTLLEAFLPQVGQVIDAVKSVMYVK
jgi:pyruvate/2-oxoglutarate/acetoin dehydrogenase E1 component